MEQRENLNLLLLAPGSLRLRPDGRRTIAATVDWGRSVQFVQSFDIILSVPYRVVSTCDDAVVTSLVGSAQNLLGRVKGDQISSSVTTDWGLSLKDMTAVFQEQTWEQMSHFESAQCLVVIFKYSFHGSLFVSKSTSDIKIIAAMIKSDEGRTTECQNFAFSVFSLEMERGSHLSCLIITHGQICQQSQSKNWTY